MKTEMINTISGITLDRVWGGRVAGSYGDVPVSCISLQDLLLNKKASGRPKDLADFDELGGTGAHNIGVARYSRYGNEGRLRERRLRQTL